MISHFFTAPFLISGYQFTYSPQVISGSGTAHMRLRLWETRGGGFLLLIFAYFSHSGHIIF